MTSQASRRRAEAREYKTNRERRYIQARGLCERCGIGLDDAWESHHVRRRSNGTDNSVENLRALCGPFGCHAWIHAHVAEAEEQGWLVSKWPQL